MPEIFTLITTACVALAGWLGTSLAAHMALLNRIAAGMLGILALRLVRN